MLKKNQSNSEMLKGTLDSTPPLIELDRRSWRIQLSEKSVTLSPTEDWRFAQ